MARPTNTFESMSMTISVTPQMKVYLEDLTVRGTFGASPAEAAKMLLSSAIESMLSAGHLTRREFKLEDGKVVVAA